MIPEAYVSGFFYKYIKEIKMKILLDEIGIKKSMTRMCYEIIERNKDLKNLVFIGIKSRGDILAERMIKKIEELENISIPLEILDITYYRDDRDIKSDNVDIKEKEFNINLTEKTIIIIDDVLYTGRTVRAALDAILRDSRPDKIQLACLIDRGHKELPIRADFIGKNIPTSKDENIEVHLIELDGVDDVEII